MQNIQQVIDILSEQIPSINYIKVIKSGKEAQVHLVEAEGKLMALKIYKDNLKYSTRNEYMPTSTIQDGRLQRAIKNKTRVGNERMKSMWTAREFKIMKDLNQILNNIPKVYAYSDNAILMEFLGNEDSSAPRLNELELTYEQALNAFNLIVNGIKVFIELGFVHGDLTLFNILWHNQKPYIIDFPQVLEIRNNPYAYSKFIKDLDNVCEFFEDVFPDEVDQGRRELLRLFYLKRK